MRVKCQGIRLCNGAVNIALRDRVAPLLPGPAPLVKFCGVDAPKSRLVLERLRFSSSLPERRDA